MLFNSYVFLLLFLPITVCAYALFLRLGIAPTGLLVVAGFVFYAWGSPWHHVLILASSIVGNFVIGHQLCQTANFRKPLAVLGVSFNLILLGIFKYSDFALGQIGFNGLAFLLPLGISFYTFTQIAYLVDVYRDRESERSIGLYAVFVTWFPHLIAGPILHHKETLSQFRIAFAGRFDQRLAIAGFSLFVVGLAKKTLIADNIAPAADAVFSSATRVALTFWEAWYGALAYTLQLYFDFSGYADMAVGLSLIFGVRIPVNFNSPYQASNIVDFWRRWHMTLSRFLRDYLYIPLGGNRRGPLRRYLALMVTMLLGGLWHGAGWTFIFWGGLHGSFLVLNHAWRALGLRLPILVAFALTFFSVVVAWVLFRAQDLNAAASVYKAMFLGNGLSLPRFLGGHVSTTWIRFDGPFNHGLFAVEVTSVWILLALAVAWFLPNSTRIFTAVQPALVPKDFALPKAPSIRWLPNVAWAAALGATLGICFLTLGGPSPFLYFRF